MCGLYLFQFPKLVGKKIAHRFGRCFTVFSTPAFAGKSIRGRDASAHLVFAFSVRVRAASYEGWWNGARYRVRTCDPYSVNVVLYH